MESYFVWKYKIIISELWRRSEYEHVEVRHGFLINWLIRKPRFPENMRIKAPLVRFYSRQEEDLAGIIGQDRSHAIEG